MGTITITTAGFPAAPATAPANWPPNVTYPAGVAPNGTKTFTVSNLDMLRLVTWTAVSQFAGTASPTMAQILLAWISFISFETRKKISQNDQQSNALNVKNNRSIINQPPIVMT